MSVATELLGTRQIRVFTAYRFSSRLYFYLPVLVVILIDQGLSLTKAAFVVAVHGVAIMLSRAPLDSATFKAVPARNRLVTGEIVKSVGIGGLTLGTWLVPGNLPTLVASQAISGVGFALTAGIDSGMLHDMLRRAGGEARYSELEARTQSYGFIAFLGSGVVGGLAATRSLVAPLAMSLPSNLIAAVCMMGLEANPDPPAQPADASGPSPAVEADAQVQRGSRWTRLHSSWSHIIFYALSRGIILTMFVWLLPIGLFVNLDVSLGFFGLILGLYSGTGFVVAQFTKRITAAIGATRLLLGVVPACLVAGILLLLPDELILYVLVAVIIGFAATFVRPLAYAAMVERNPDHRAEVISTAETLLGVVNAALVLISAALMENSNRAPLLLLGMLVAVATIVGALGAKDRRAAVT